MSSCVDSPSLHTVRLPVKVQVVSAADRAALEAAAASVAQSNEMSSSILSDNSDSFQITAMLKGMLRDAAKT